MAQPVVKKRQFANPTRTANVDQLAAIGTRNALAGGTKSRWPHLRGDLDFLPAVGDALEALAAASHQIFQVNSGRRTIAEQANVKSTYGPKAAATPNAPHVAGYSADVSVNGKPIWSVFDAKQLAAAGLGTFPGGSKSDPVHVQLLGKGNTVGGPGGDAGAGAEVTGAGGLITGGLPSPDDIARAIVSGLVDSIGEFGVRALLYLFLTGSGAVLAGLGVRKMAGARADAATPGIEALGQLVGGKAGGKASTPKGATP